MATSMVSVPWLKGKLDWNGSKFIIYLTPITVKAPIRFQEFIKFLLVLLAKGEREEEGGRKETVLAVHLLKSSF